MTPNGAQTRTVLLRRFRILRGTGFLLIAAGVAALAWTERRGLGFAVVTMALGAFVAWFGAFWLSHLEDPQDHRARRAMRFLLVGDGLKLAALPAIALGGSWLAWGGGPSFAASLAFAGLGVSAFAYGLVLRIDGVSMLPDNAPTWRTNG